jgi:hypothetical protein
MPGVGLGIGLPLGLDLDWTPLQLGSDLKLWLRPESLSNPNLLTYTGQQGKTFPPWAKFNMTVTDGYSDPLGGTTAALYEPTASVGNENSEQDPATTPADGTVVTGSYYAKKAPGHDGVGKAHLQLYDGVAATTGTAVTLTDSWQRITATHTMSPSSTRLRVQIVPCNSTSPGQDSYVAFPQLEVGSAPTTYVENVATAGGIVSQWDDSSGLGNHATQATQANMPLVVAGALDNKSGALFDNVDDRLTLTSNLSFAGPFEVYAVYAKTDGAAGATWLGYNGSSYMEDQASELVQTGILADIDNLSVSSATPTPGTFGLVNVKRDGSNNLTARVDNVDITNGTPAATGTPFVLNLVGAKTIVVSSALELVELVVVDAVLSATEATNINTYFRNGYPTIGVA